MDFWDDLVDDADDNPFGGDQEAGSTAAEEEPVGDAFADPSGSVRVWVGSEGQVARVSLANNWRDRAKSPLAARFRMAFRNANLALLATTEGANASITSTSTDLDALDPADLRKSDFFDAREVGELIARTVDLMESAGQVGEEEPEIAFTPAIGASSNRNVTVTLGMRRELVGMTMDEEWARGARAERIAKSVTEALQAAYERWQEPTAQDSAAARVSGEASDLRRSTESLLERYSRERNGS